MVTPSHAVVVRKGGFFSALAYGVFGTLTAAIICGSAVGVYALRIVDRKADRILELGDRVLQLAPQWRTAAPPVIAEALDDRRAPEYREQLDVNVRLAAGERERRGVAVIEVHNRGPEVVTLLAARVVLRDERGVPVHEFNTYLATPFALDDNDGRGPLQPGSTRAVTRSLYRYDPRYEAQVEITDVRVWNAAGAAPRRPGEGAERGESPARD